MQKAVLQQCKSCPWRVETVPEKDIPNGYCATKHANLRSTLAENNSPLSNTLRLMACHHSMPGKEKECVGWVHNQLGLGNNIALRLRARDGRYNNLVLLGEQHERFEDTLPKER